MKRGIFWFGDDEELVDRFADKVSELAQQEPFIELDFEDWVQE